VAEFEELSGLGLTILMVAVRLAKDKQISKASTLRRLLVGEFPGREREVDEALNAWGMYERRKMALQNCMWIAR
jgi:hypothetical protein